MSTEETATRIVEVTLTELEDRKGFDWWWDDLDDGIRDEIRQALERKVHSVLASGGGES